MWILIAIGNEILHKIKNVKNEKETGKLQLFMPAGIVECDDELRSRM